MKVVRLAIGVVGLLVSGIVCSSCGLDAGTAKEGLTPQQLEEAKTKQKGVGGVKAQMGGGVMPAPEIPKPGEHVGPPPSGGKAGG